MKRIRMNLQLFAEEIPGAESVPAAEEQTIPQASSESGAETTVAAEPEKNNFEKAFAKRLADAKASWEAEKQKELEQYKDYDVYKRAAEFLQRENGISDIMSLKEQLELADLQHRAERENLTVDELRRQQQLEALQAKVSQFEQSQQEAERVSAYHSALSDFVKEKNVDADKLNQFMVENGLTYDPQNPSKSFTFALKAMRHDELEAQLETAKKAGVKEFLQAKSTIPTVTGATAQGQVSSGAPKTWAEARARAMQRFTSEQG